MYYIPHNYVIPQAMPHAIPQTHSPFTLTDARAIEFDCASFLAML